MSEHPSRVPAPDLAPGDVYLYAFDNGAVFVLGTDGRSQLSPLDDAVEVAAGCHAAGCRVVLGRDPGPVAGTLTDRLRSQGVPAEEIDAAAPQTWSDGTTALMEAAAHGNDRLLDDLVARGATLHDRDVSGSTALHHAAANGNVHALEALVGAGLDPDDRNRDGFTPYRLATATRQLAAAQRLADLGADTGAGADGAITFRGHGATTWAWWAIPILDVAAAVIIGATVHPVAGLAFAVVTLAIALRLRPPSQHRAGGAPRRLTGTTLTIRGASGTRDLDLRQVTTAAIAGATGDQAYLGGRSLLLDHPDGAPADRDALRRLGVPAAELDAVAGRMGRVVVVPLAGGHHREVVLAVGNVLSGLGVEMSPSLRAQLARAREEART